MTEQTTRASGGGEPGARTDKTALMVAALPVDHRKAIWVALRLAEEANDEKALEYLTTIIKGLYRAEMRRRSDRKTDTRRRRIVGAKLPIETAERCQWAAESEGLSLNSWCRRALLGALARSEYLPGETWDDDGEEGPEGYLL